jgi:hypothetical protein
MAHAGLVNVFLDSASGVGSSQSYGAAYQGTMQWSYTSGSSATITLQLTNTSSVMAYLSAFVVGMADPSFVVTQIAAPTAFNQLTGNGLKANPFGDYDWGSASTSSFNGGGTGNTGLARGQSGTWTFSVSGAAAMRVSRRPGTDSRRAGPTSVVARTAAPARRSRAPDQRSPPAPDPDPRAP